jgi:23S rRNA pseudoU1915 N3-methylase RlmH
MATRLRGIYQNRKRKRGVNVMYRSETEKFAAKIDELNTLADTLRVLEIYDKEWERQEYCDRFDFKMLRNSIKLIIGGRQGIQMELNGLPRSISQPFLAKLKILRDEVKQEIRKEITRQKGEI